MSLLKSAWLNFAKPLWQREAVEKLDEHERLHGAYGSLSITTEVADSDYGAGWEPLDFFMAQGVVPLNMSMNLNGIFVFNDSGAYKFSVAGLFFHNNAGQERDINLRIFNITQGVVVTQSIVDTPSGSRSTVVNVMVLLDVAIVGDQLRLEIGGGDTYTQVEWQSLFFNVFNVGILEAPL